MPVYTPWATLADLQTWYNGGAGHPFGTDAASDLDDSVRQLQGFLCTFLAASFHPTTGKLLPAAFDAGTYATDTIPASSISGDIDGSTQIQAGTITNAQLSIYGGAHGAAVVANVIDDGAIIDRHISAGGIGEGKLAAGAIDSSTMFKAGIVNNAALATNAVADGNVSGVSGTKIAVGTIEATSLATTGLAAGTVGLHAIDGDGATNNEICVIGGALTATIEPGTPPTLKFALAAGDGENYARFTSGSSGASVASTWTARGSWTKNSGGATKMVVGTPTTRIVLGSAGTYLIYFRSCHYSTEGTACQISMNAGALTQMGSGVFLPLGTGGASEGLGLITATASTDYIELEYYCERVDAHGLGYAGAVAGVKFAEITIVQLV